jgi:hypothetical protein
LFRLAAGGFQKPNFPETKTSETCGDRVLTRSGGVGNGMLLLRKKEQMFFFAADEASWKI